MKKPKPKSVPLELLAGSASGKEKISDFIVVRNALLPFMIVLITINVVHLLILQNLLNL